MTPGALRAEAVRQVIGTMHSGHVSGPWDLVQVEQHGLYAAELTFAVGYIDAHNPVDTRQRVKIHVEEVRG